jgi:hypothetical protein
MLKRLLKIFRNLVFISISIIILLMILINITPVQNYIAQKTIHYLSNTLNTKVSLKHISLRLFNTAVIQELYIEDQHKDTLLYAGEASVHITDWFFLKEKPQLQFLGLKNAVVNINRSRQSDEWNYQFIVDAFASTKQDTSTKKSSFNLDIKTIELEQVRCNMIDAWVGSDYVWGVENFSVSARDIDYKNKKMDIRFIKGNKVVIGIRDYKGGRPPKPHSNKLPLIDTTPFNPGNWLVNISDFQLADSRFFYDDPDDTLIEKSFDEVHIDVRDIQLDAKHIAIVGDTLVGELKHLQAKERCGFELIKMAANVKVSPNIAECKNLILQTPYSNIGDYYAMHYKRFPDFKDYIEKVTMVSTIRRAEVAIKDIAYFAPALERFNNIAVVVSGKAKGTVDNLLIKDFDLNDGLNHIAGDLSFKGLPEIEDTYMEGRSITLQTSAAGAYLYTPQLKNASVVNVAALHKVVFQGDYVGYLSRFTTKGNLITSVGNAQVDLAMKIPDKGLIGYAGTIQLQHFDLGTLFQQKLLGPTSLQLQVEGEGIDIENAALKGKGTVQQFTFNQYSYANIDIDGSLITKVFSGKLNINDPNLDMDFDGKIKFSKSDPQFDLFADIAYINTQALHFVNQDIVGNAKVKFDFAGSNIDNFIGAASIYNMNVLKDKNRINIDSVQLLSHLVADGSKALTLKSNQLALQVQGAYTLSSLPESIQLYLSYYLPQYVKRPAVIPEPQNFSFDFVANSPNDLIALMQSDVSISNSTHLSGSMNMQEQKLSLSGVIPFVKYKEMVASNISIESEGSYQGLDLNLTVNGIKLGTTDLISTLQYQSHLFQDTATFKVLTTSPTSLGSATLNGVAYANNDSFYLKILPSEFLLNENRWEILNNNEIIFGKNAIAFDNINLVSGLQKIGINTQGRDALNKANINILNFDIDNLNALFDIAHYEFDGRINGEINLQNLLHNPIAEFDLYGNDMIMDEDTVGVVKAIGKYDGSKQVITLFPQSGLQYKEAGISITGDYSLKPEMQENIDALLSFNNAKVAWGQPFLEGYVHQLSGTINGDIQIKGNSLTPITTGSLQFKDVGFTPDIIGAHYVIDEALIKVSDTRFEFGTVAIRDEQNNKGYITGNIAHNKLSKLNFRLNLRSDKLKVVKLNELENNNFYGDVNASVQLRLNGTVKNLNLNIFAIPLPNSKLFIPISYEDGIGSYDYISFKKYGAAEKVINHQEHNKFNIRLDVVTTPDLETTIILDQNTKDQIWAKGNGNITLEIPSEGNLKMNGNYVIDEGKYNFSFKELQVLNYKREFTINQNSVIKWNGDIADADLDVSAYAQIKARLYDLIVGEIGRIGLTEQETKDAQTAQMVNVMMNMRGSLKQPEFKFNLDLAETRSVGTYAYQKLQRINADDKQKLNQVASLLILEQFIPPEGINNSDAVTSGTINNMSELLTSAASAQISNFANKIFGMQDLSVDVKYKNYTLSNATIDAGGTINYLNRNMAGVNLRKSFLNNRLIVDVGGVYDWGFNKGQDNLSSNLAGDFRIQYLLNEDGSIRFNVFRTSSYDALYAQVLARQGAGITYRKSFNNVFDLFRSQSMIQKMNLEREAKEDARNAAPEKKDTTATPATPLEQ